MKELAEWVVRIQVDGHMCVNGWMMYKYVCAYISKWYVCMI